MWNPIESEGKKGGEKKPLGGERRKGEKKREGKERDQRLRFQVLWNIRPFMFPHEFNVGLKKEKGEKGGGGKRRGGKMGLP